MDIFILSGTAHCKITPILRWTETVPNLSFNKLATNGLIACDSTRGSIMGKRAHCEFLGI